MTDETNPHNDPHKPEGDGPKMEAKTFNLCWSGRDGMPVPAIGDRVKVTFNGLGTGTVLGYFTECNFLGVKLQLDNPPDWYVKQNNGNIPAHVFGMEIKPVE